MKKNITWIAGLVAFVLVIIGASLLYNKLGEDFDRNSLLNNDNADADLDDNDGSSQTENNNNNNNDAADSSGDITDNSGNITDSGKDDPTNKEESNVNTGESGGNSQENGSNEEEEEDIPFPSDDFTVLDYNGNEVKLSDMKGKPIIINFWASWCPGCVSEMSAFDEVYKEYKDKVNFMMINLPGTRNETIGSAKQFVESNGYTFPVYFDTTFEASDTYSAYYLPTTIFFDAKGNALTPHIGALTASELRAQIAKLLG